MKDIPSCDWLQQWTDLARRYGDIYTCICTCTCKMLTVLEDLYKYLCEDREGSLHSDFVSCRFAFQYNPALQPRAIIVFGCISKTVTDSEIKQLLKIMMKVGVPFVLSLYTHISTFAFMCNNISKTGSV